jgi:hypothetical protein
MSRCLAYQANTSTLLTIAVDVGTGGKMQCHKVVSLSAMGVRNDDCSIQKTYDTPEEAAYHGGK